MVGKVRNRRLQSYWEPIYNPQEKGPFPEVGAHDNRTGFLRATVKPEALGQNKTVKSSRFDCCDFSGTFFSRFEGCDFELCDFGLSTWRYAKFRNCRFIKSSFTQATFQNCEFRGCIWQDIGLSGNETSFVNTKVSNPKDFIRAAYTNTDQGILSMFNKTPAFQKMRLEYTKANVARNLLNCLAHSGEESWYYESVEIYNIQSFRAPRFFWHNRAISERKKLKKFLAYLLTVGYFLEQKIVQFLGIFNKWGGSLLRPALFGLLVQLFFAFVYWRWSFASSWWAAIVASIDISVVVGYTKYANQACPLGTQLVYLTNMLAGVFWFAIVVPTLMNRISRVR